MKENDVHFNRQLTKDTCWLISLKNSDKKCNCFLQKKNGYLYCFDPLYSKNLLNKNWEIGTFDGGCNLKIKIDFLNAHRNNERYRAGNNQQREMVIMKKNNERKARL